MHAEQEGSLDETLGNASNYPAHSQLKELPGVTSRLRPSAISGHLHLFLGHEIQNRSLRRIKIWIFI